MSDNTFYTENCYAVIEELTHNDGTKVVYVSIKMKDKNTHLVSIPISDIEKHTEWHWIGD